MTQAGDREGAPAAGTAEADRQAVLGALLTRAAEVSGAALAAWVEGMGEATTVSAATPGTPALARAVAATPPERWPAIARGGGAADAATQLPPLADAGAAWCRVHAAAPPDAATKHLVLVGTTGAAPDDDGTLDALARAAGDLAIAGGRGALEAQALNHAGSGVTIADARAPDLPLIHVNDPFLRMTGYTRAEVLGRNCRFLQGHEDRDESALERVRQALRDGRGCTVRLRNRRKNGELFWNELHLAPLHDAAGRITHFVGVQIDVTENVVLTEQLAHERNECRRMIDASPNGIVVVDAEGTVRFANAVAQRMLGDPEVDLVGHPLGISLATNPPNEITIHRGGPRAAAPGIAELHVSRTEWDDEPAWMAVLNDVTARRNAEHAARVMAYTDTLTGLANRDRLRERLDRALVEARRAGTRVALVLLDMDRFKEINDSMGHTRGDEFLVQVAARLSTVLRESDLVARFGGDEFAVLIQGVRTRQDGATVGQKIVEAFAEPLKVGGRPMSASCSVGVSLFPDDADNAVTLMQHADAAMYHAKAAGGGNSTLYHEGLTKRAEQRLELDQSLSTALAQGQFVVHFQKQVALTEAEHRLVGLEALVRWDHPERGLVGPGEFIEHLEDLDLIGALTRYVLEAVCRQINAWGERLPAQVPVSLNLSARELRDTDLAPTLAGILGRHGVDPCRISFELTESAAATDIVQAMHTLGELRAYGAHVALDDFGKGFSALNYLRVLPIDTVKIDRDFVTELPDDASAALLRAIVEMAHGIGKAVVAEGVETHAQARFLRDIGCDFAQGFLFARPHPAEELALEPARPADP